MKALKSNKLIFINQFKTETKESLLERCKVLFANKKCELEITLLDSKSFWIEKKSDFSRYFKN